MTSISPLTILRKNIPQFVLSDLDLLIHIKTSLGTRVECPSTFLWSKSENGWLVTQEQCPESFRLFSWKENLSGTGLSCELIYNYIFWQSQKYPMRTHLSSFQHCYFWPAQRNTETIGKGKRAGRESCIKYSVVWDSAFVRQSLG